MRRSQVDDARRRQAAAERRFRGHRIRSGLDELGDLDVPAAQKQRTESTPLPSSSDPSSKETTASAAAASSGSTTAIHDGAAVYAMVFGKDWSEWLEVKRALFDPDSTAASKKAALRRIGVWRVRARKERVLPPYVESTEVLVDAMVQDATDALDDGPLRMCYGAALARVVHVMTGSFASGSADTYRKRAHEIGFPEEAVEVRQRVAHGALPLTSELRWVCGLVLQFLFTEYWLEQERQLYLMKEIDNTPVVTTAEAESSAAKETGAMSTKRQQQQQQNKKGGKGKREAAVQPAAVAPPSVSMDDMKALLADLECDEGERETAATAAAAVTVATTKATEVEKKGEAAKTAVAAAAEASDASPPRQTMGGWLLS